MSRLDELDVILRQKNGKFTASIPQLRLYATGDTAASAVVALDTKRDALAAELAAVGELETLQFDDRPGAARGERISAAEDLFRFAIKGGIVLLVLVVLFGFAVAVVQSRVDTVLASFKNARFGGEPFWTKVEEEIDWMARPDDGFSEEKKQRLLADIRAIGVKWRPFVVEIRSALDGSNAPAQASPTPDKK